MSASNLPKEADDFPVREGVAGRTLLICTHPYSGGTMLSDALLLSGVRVVKLFWQDLEKLAHKIDPTSFNTEGWPLNAAGQCYRDLWARVAHILPEAEFIHLERRDRLRQAAASLAAVRSSERRSTDDLGPPAQQPSYDRERIAANIALADHSHRHWRQFFAAIGEVPHEVGYEDLDRDYGATVAAVLAHLGSNASMPPQRIARQSDAHTEAMVLRFLRDSQAGALMQQ